MIQKLALASLALVALVVGACVMTAACPCGSDFNDPLREHDLSYVGEHTVEDECVCQCGIDISFGLSIDRDCSDYEGSCTDSQGTRQELVCE